MASDPQIYIMVVETTDWLHRMGANQLSLFTQKLHNSISNSLENHDGIIVSCNDNHYVVSFKSVTDAVLCALKIQHKFKYSTPKVNNVIHDLHLSIVEKGISETESISIASFLCNSLNDKIIITSDVKYQYEIENDKIKIDTERIKTLKKANLRFLIKLQEFLISNWRNPYLMVSHLTKPLDYSSSQIYNKLMALTGKSPSEFIRDFRLKRALESIHNKKGNIAQIAKANGFGSSSYFAKSFKNRFGMTPMDYAKMN